MGGLCGQGGDSWGPGETWGEGGQLPGPEDTRGLGGMVWKAAAQGQGPLGFGGDKGCPKHLLPALRENRAMQGVAATSGSCP